MSPHQDLIARALGLNLSRVLEYGPPKAEKKGLNVQEEELWIPCATESRDKSINSAKNLKNTSIVDTSSILQAPGLKNDFYYNLVSWSGRTGKITVGLGANAYTWSTDKRVETVDLGQGHLPIVCVSTSAFQYSAITFVNGDVVLIDQEKQQKLAQFNNNGAAVHVLTWVDNQLFFMGDEVGMVQWYRIEGTEAVRVAELKWHRHQICGMFTAPN